MVPGKRPAPLPPASSHLGALGLAIATALCVAFTALNRDVARDHVRQSILTAVFCTIASVMYVLYMLVSRLVALVLNHVERGHHQAYYYDELSGGDEPYPPTHEDEGGEQAPLCPRSRAATVWRALSVLAASDTPSSRRRQSKRTLALLHRDAVISSMYLGGAGAFLALPPLCMWDLSVTVAFVASLALLGAATEHAKVADFRPNVDAAGALRALARLRAAPFGAIGLTLAAVAWQDVHTTRPRESAAFARALVVADLPAAANATAAAAALLPAAAVALVGDEGLLQWPLMLLAAASPPLLRIGVVGSRGGGHALSKVLMTPSQTLESALPVGTLLATLVLCWNSPVYEVFPRGELLTRLAVPMLVLCPPALAAALAFILRAFRKRQTVAAAAVLTLACAVRQQAADCRLAAPADWAVLAGAGATVLIVAAAAWHRASVVQYEEAPPAAAAPPPPTPPPPPPGQVSLDGLVDDSGPYVARWAVGDDDVDALADAA